MHTMTCEVFGGTRICPEGRKSGGLSLHRWPFGRFTWWQVLECFPLTITRNQRQSPRVVKVEPPKVAIQYVEETYDLANALWRITAEWEVGTDPQQVVRDAKRKQRRK